MKQFSTGCERISRIFGLLAFGVFLIVGAARADNLTVHGGSVMINPIRAYMVYWLPAGVVLDTNVTGGIGNFRSLTGQFFSNLAPSRYLNILTQYPGVCAGKSCVLENKAGAVTLGGSWTDTQAYPHAGTQKDPLQDADIQAEVTRAIAQNGWTVDSNSVFFVVTGVFNGATNKGQPVEECDRTGANCTFKGNSFCGYHFDFTSGGSTILYSFLADINYITGCSEGLTTSVSGQLSTDREIALISHELFETITDPDVASGWFDSAGAEISDKCNQIPSTVLLNGTFYAVQQQWSNASAKCVDSYTTTKSADMTPLFEMLVFKRPPCLRAAECTVVEISKLLLIR